ncbi:ABC transporter ATP-binding protein [Roseiflexus castenholzii]|uniref:ABC transporter related n=1 Tax=Roseiflexus castenholzii (strain DSM 13941 / HLO8) TaxID=383372 RepID=A7NNP0_ROSCS|nr:ABC transporter ATP-binding protein [Roseiflexus castenholzii]ABU59181.1 ABC transporter related [Roseiflexus castenholzii DSM 13941]
MKHSGLRFLLPYMAPYRRHLIVGTIYALISASASAFSPALLGRAIDDVLAGIRTDRLVWYAVGLIALATTLAVFRYLLRMLTGWIAVGVSYRMSQDLFDRVLLFDQATAQSYGVGDLLSRASNDFIYIWRFYSAGFQMSMHALFLLAIGTVLMALSSPLLAALVVALLFASLGVQVGLGRVLERAFDHVQQRMARLSAFAQEHLSAMRMLAAYAQERSVVAAFQQSNEAYVRSNLDFVLRSAAIAPLPSLVVRLAAAVVLGLGGALVVGGAISVGQYVQFIVYLGLLSAAAQQLSQAYERLQQGSAAAGRIGEVLRRRSRIVDAPDAIALMPSGDICFEGVGVRATGDSRWIVRGIDLRIAAGTTLGIVGATGAGKSTLLSLIGRVRDPDEGRITIGGVDIRRIRLETLRRSVVYVPQEPLLFSISVRDNIALGLTGVPDELVHRAAHAARLTNDLAQLPQGLATIVGERGATLSGGQKQRTAIARALVRDPSILLLDDTLSSVDAQTAAEILRELAAAREGRTVVMVSQRMAAVRDADQIIVLHEGGIVEQGDHQSLLALNGRYAAMYRRELRQAEESEESIA